MRQSRVSFITQLPSLSVVARIKTSSPDEVEQEISFYLITLVAKMLLIIISRCSICLAHVTLVDWKLLFINNRRRQTNDSRRRRPSIGNIFVICSHVCLHSMPSARFIDETIAEASHFEWFNYMRWIELQRRRLERLRFQAARDIVCLFFSSRKSDTIHW